MPHEPTAPPGIHFFGRIDRFHCACPGCGTLIIACKDRGLAGRQFKNLRRRVTTYNPVTSILYCPECRRSYGVGLLLWSFGPGRRHRIPPDQQPTDEQLRGLQQYTLSIWGRKPKKPGEGMNVVVDGECTCPTEVGGWEQTCPVHGWEKPEVEEKG